MIIYRYQAQPGKAYPEALPRVERIIEISKNLTSV